MKITPLWLFLILLLVLVLAILFSKFLPISNADSQEGFVSFNYNKQPIDYIYIPQYSREDHDVVKLYDNVFFDTINGNLVEVDGTAYVSGNTSTISGNIGGNIGGNTRTRIVNDMSYSSINGVYVVQRNGNVNTNPYTSVFAPSATGKTITARNTPESLINSMHASYSAWQYTTVGKNTDNYQVFYFPWNLSTYVHIIRLTSGTQHVSSFMFGSNQTMETFNYGSNQTISIGAPVPDNDASNNSNVVVKAYNPKQQVYQISHTVAYDQNNGNLIITNVDNSVTVYNRYGNAITDYSTSYQSKIPNTYFKPWIVPDAANNMVLYMPYGQNTLIALLSMDPMSTTYQKFKIVNTVRFNKNGLDVPPANTGSSSYSSRHPDIDDDTDDGPHSLYYKWLAYWHTTTSNPSNSYTNDDYILKTQIVPPVCPSCPTCPSIGTCTNCGGQGGSGTISDKGASMVGSVSTEKGAVNVAANASGPSTVLGNGQLATTTDTSTLGGATSTAALGAVSGVENVAQVGGSALKGTVQTVGGLGNNLINTTGNLLSSAGSGTTDLLKSAGSGTTGLLTSAGSGAVDLLKSAGSGVQTVLTPQQYQQQYQQQYGSATQRGSATQGGSYGAAATQGSYGGVTQGRSGGVPTSQYTGLQVNGNVPGVDNYSYYGALPAKTSNFLPITADFSAFGK